jgi:hypothetical protein
VNYFNQVIILAYETYYKENRHNSILVGKINFIDLLDFSCFLNSLSNSNNIDYEKCMAYFMNAKEKLGMK